MSLILEDDLRDRTLEAFEQTRRGRELLNTISFTLPLCPPSVNSLYQIHYKAANPNERVQLRPECRQWKTSAKLYVPAFSIREDSILRVDRTYFYPWFSKKKTWKKRDSGNMDKLLFDIIAEKLGVDDSRFKEGMMSSVNSQTEKTLVVLTEVTMREWSRR